MSQIPAQNEVPLKPKGIKCISFVGPLIHPLLADYVGPSTPEFTLDSFKKMFSQGNFVYDSFSSKENKKINLSSFLSLNNFLFEGLNIQFPDERKFFVLECTKMRIAIDYRNWYKEKLESFIDYVIAQIEGKKNPLEDNKIKSGLNSVKQQIFWNNFKINLNDLEIAFRWQKTIECILSIKKVFYDHKEQKGEIKGIEIKIIDNTKKLTWNILKPFDIKIVYQGDIDQLKFEFTNTINLTVQETMYESVELLSKIFNKKGKVDSQKSNQNNDNNVLYENVDKEDNLNLNSFNFNVVSLLQNSKEIITKRLLDNKEKAKKEAKKNPLNFFGFVWGRKDEDEEEKKDEPVTLSNEEIEKLNNHLSNETITKFINGTINENVKENVNENVNKNNNDNKNKNTSLFTLPQISPIFEFNNNIELIVEFEIKNVKDSFKLEFTTITYNNQSLNYTFSFSILLTSQNSYILSPTLYTINITKEEKTNTSIVDVNFDELQLTISVNLINKLEQLYDVLLNSNIANIIKSLNFSQATNTMRDNISSNMKLILTNNKIKVIYVEKQCSSSISISKSLITILPPSENHNSSTKQTQPIKISLQTNKTNVVVHNNSPLFLSFVTFLFTYDPNAPNNNNTNKNKSNETSQPLEIDFISETFNIFYNAKPTKIIFSLNNLHYNQLPTLIDLSSSSFQSTILPESIIVTQQQTISIQYALSTNKLTMTMPSPTVFLTDKQLDIVIKAFTLDLDINIKIEDFIFVVIIPNIKINYNSFLVQIETFKIENKKSNYYAQINEFVIRSKNKKLLTEKKILLNMIEQSDTKKEINIECSELNISVIQEDLYKLLLQVKFNELLSNKEKSSTNMNQKSNNKNNTIYSLNVQFNCIKFNLLLLKKNTSTSITSHTNVVSTLSINKMKYIYNPGDLPNTKEEEVITVQFITFIFIDSFNKEHMILTQVDNSFQLQSTDKGTPTKTIKDDDQQIIISKNKILINITITSLQIFLRFDAILFLYYFFYNSIPFQRIMNDVTNIQPKYNIQINLENVNFLLQTSYDANEILLLGFPSINFIYSASKKNPFPCGLFFVHINQIQGYFTSLSNKKRKRIFISSKQNVNYLSTFSLDISDLQKIKLTLTITDAYINALYTDFISLLKAYQFNKFYIKHENRITMNSNSNDKALSNKFNLDKTKLTISFTWDTLNVTLIDNAKNKYLPFMTFTLDTLNINSVSKNKFQVAFAFNVDSYNYIALTWEPTIEKMKIQTLINYSQTDNISNISCQTEIDSLLLNISDMNVSFVFAALSNWIEQFQSEIENYDMMLLNLIVKMQKQDLPLNQIKSDSKVIVSNNTVWNYSGETIEIGYNDNNIRLQSLTKTNLEYDPEMKERFIDLKYKDKKFKISIEKIGSIMNTVAKDCYFISEIALTKERTIDINIYPPIVFLNQTNADIKIIIKPSINSDNNESIIFVLKHNHQQGIPFSLLTKSSTLFYFIFDNESSTSYLLQEVTSTPLNGKYVKFVRFKTSHKIFQLKMINDIPNVRKLVIGYKYSIVNALPFTLILKINNSKPIQIYKCKKKNINANQDDSIRFEIICDGVSFVSESKIFLSLESKSSAEKRGNITFRDINNRELQIKLIFNSKKELIFYGEYFIKNESGIALDIKEDKKSKFLYNINQQLYIVSPINDLEKCSISLEIPKYTPNKISFETLLESSSKVNITLKLSSNNNNNSDNDKINLRIRDELSYVVIKNDPLFNETIISKIFSITGTFFIYNQLSDKEILIRPTNTLSFRETKFPPLTKLNFHQSINSNPIQITFVDLQTKKTHSIHKFACKPDIITLYIFNIFINIEVRLNNFENITEMFIYESNIRNAKIILDNKSSYAILIQQSNFLEDFQIVNPNKKEICKVYDHTNSEFLIATDNNLLKFNYEKYTEDKIIPISNRIYLQNQTNGIKRKLTFFDREQMSTFKNISSLMFDFIVIIKQTIISLISDNEFIHKKVNKNYRRNEIGLIVLQSCRIGYNINQKLSFDTNYTHIDMRIKSIMICNQISEYGKFPIFIENIGETQSNEFLILDCNIVNYPIDNMSELKKFILVLDKMKVSVDPNFMLECLNFLDNVAYRSNVSFYNINDIFISDPLNVMKNNILKLSSNDSHLILAKNISLPKMDIKLRLSEIGLNELLKDKFGVSYFSRKIIKQLAGHTNPIKLNEKTIPLFRGGILDFIEQIIYMYQAEAVGLVNNIALRGIALAIKNVFRGEEGVSEEVKDKRVRPPRNFYGKYKYIKDFNLFSANIQRNILENYNNYPFLKGHYFVDGIQTSYNIFLFTNITLFIFNRSNKPVCEQQIDYFCVKNVKCDINDASVFLVSLSQVIDAKKNIEINTHIKGMGKTIGKKLMEYSILYKEEFSYLD